MKLGQMKGNAEGHIGTNNMEGLGWVGVACRWVVKNSVINSEKPLGEDGCPGQAEQHETPGY